MIKGNVLLMLVLFGPAVALADQFDRMPSTTKVEQIKQENPFPTDESVNRKQGEWRPRLDSILEQAEASKPGALQIKVPEARVSIPNFRAKRPDLDLGKMAEYFERLRRGEEGPGQAKKSELLVFVSFSIPEVALRRIIEQTTEAGGAVILRGPVGASAGNAMRMEETYRALGKLGFKKKVNVQINPPAFQHFSIDAVPAFVLADSGTANRITENGCASPQSYIKVSGEVSVEIALREIEKRTTDEQFRQFAASYLAQLNTVK